MSSMYIILFLIVAINNSFLPYFYFRIFYTDVEPLEVDRNIYNFLQRFEPFQKSLINMFLLKDIK